MENKTRHKYKYYAIRGFARWFLARLCRRLVKNGVHRYGVTEYYRVMWEVAEAEFTECNRPTLDGFLRDCHDKAGEIA